MVGLELYYDAFWELLTCRGEAGSIPWTAIHQYGAANGFDGEQVEMLTHHAREMEGELNAHHKRQREKSK